MPSFPHPPLLVVTDRHEADGRYIGTGISVYAPDSNGEITSTYCEVVFSNHAGKLQPILLYPADDARRAEGSKVAYDEADMSAAMNLKQAAGDIVRDFFKESGRKPINYASFDKLSSGGKDVFCNSVTIPITYEQLGLLGDAMAPVAQPDPMDVLTRQLAELDAALRRENTSDMRRDPRAERVASVYAENMTI